MTEHYFSRTPSAPAVENTVTLTVGGQRHELLAATGTFSHEHVDAGTAVLIENMPEPAGETFLDLGCGYGPIACAVALRAPQATVWAVDVNERALHYAATNAERLGLAGIKVAAPEGVDPEVRFDAIYSNPPIRVGKAVLHAMLNDWLPRLAPGGAAYLVVHRNLGSDSLQRWLAGEGYVCERLVSVEGYRVLRASGGA